LSNSFNISLAPDLAAIETKIDTIDTEVDSIRSADLPAIDTKIDTIDTEVDSVRSADFPATDALITTVDTVVDSLLATPRPGFVPSDDIIVASNPNDTTNEIVFTTVKSFLFATRSVFRITYEIFCGNSTATATANIFKNTVAFGTERAVFGTTPESFTEDLVFETGDFLELMIKTDNASYWAGCQNMTICAVISGSHVVKVSGS